MINLRPQLARWTYCILPLSKVSSLTEWGRGAADARKSEYEMKHDQNLTDISLPLLLYSISKFTLLMILKTE